MVIQNPKNESLPMNCIFCEIPVVFSTYVTRQSNIGKCENCKTIYKLLLNNRTLDHYQFECQSYWCAFYTNPICFKLFDKMFYTILQLDYLPNLTPQNIEQKLPMLLTFS